jgi:hypothetical protein
MTSKTNAKQPPGLFTGNNKHDLVANIFYFKIN